MFRVIDLSAGNSLLDALTGQEKLFETGEEASQAAVTQSNLTGNKWQPRAASKDLNWREREANRFLDKTYTKVPFYRRDFWKNSPLLNEHFAHVSTLKSGMIAFTESDEQGQINKKVTLRPGRYLTRYFSLLSDSEVKECCALFNNKHDIPGELLFAETADDIEETYVLGPDSCMSNEQYRERQGWNHFQSSFHPTRVYASGDLQVAYIRNDKGWITARSLIYPAKKTHSRVYGNSPKLSELLFQAGYRFRPPFDAKVLKVIENGMAVLPYIDRGNSSGGGSLLIQEIPGDDKYLRIVETPTEAYYEASQLSGLCRKNELHRRRSRMEPDDEPTYICSHCNNEIENGEYREVVIRATTNRLWCEECVDSEAFFCSGYEQYYSNEHNIPIENANGDYYCQRYYDQYCFTCAVNDTVHHNDDGIVMDNGDRWCRDAFDEQGFVCEKTGACLSVDEQVEIYEKGYTEYVSRKWAEANGYGPDGKKLQLSLEIEEHEKEIAF